MFAPKVFVYWDTGGKGGGWVLGYRPERMALLEIVMVGPARFERATLCLEGRCSIQLSYGPVQSILAVRSREKHLIADWPWLYSPELQVPGSPF